MSSASDLCTACGLCCGGVLFNGLRLDGEPPDQPGMRRLPVIHDTEGVWMRLPCVAFTDKCTIYEERPSPCAGYKCELLDALEEGEVPLDDALARVADVKRQVAAVRAGLPAPTDCLRDDVDALANQSMDWKEAHLDFLVQVVRLRETLARFIDRRSGLGVSDASHAASRRR